MASAPRETILLSIIVPFFNTWRHADRLVATLASLDDPEVEIVLVDDGSTDDTFAQLQNAIHDFRGKVRLIRQDNSGPGGARNTGLAEASGSYVWFVDSDDSICPVAIERLKILAGSNYDFIDFNHIVDGEAVNAMQLAEGEYVVSADLRSSLFEGFGMTWAKIFRADYIRESELTYPTDCIYEDNLLLFLYPLHTNRFYKVDEVGYVYNMDHVSVTRTGGAVSPRFFDRLMTARQGCARALALGISERDRRVVARMFARLFLVNSVALSRLPGPSWITAMRVMRAYRDESKRMGIAYDPRRLLGGSAAFRGAFALLWKASVLMPPQDAYFAALRRRAWPAAS